MKKFILGMNLSFFIGISSVANAEDIYAPICYPIFNSEEAFCQAIKVPKEGYLNGLIDAGRIEKGLTAISKYGYKLSDTLEHVNIENPIFEALIMSQKDKAIEAISAVGGGPILAILNLALDNVLTGGSEPDPIAQLAELLLNRLAKVEERIINRIDEQFQQEVRDSFAGLSQLYEIYGTANTLEKRAQPLYLARLSAVDVSLDRLIENFQNDRFQNAHVKNYHVYLELVALRLAVLAEVERMTYYGLYGDALPEAYPEYKYALDLQYKIVLQDVFEYVDWLTSSSEWRTDSDARFDFSNTVLSTHSGYSASTRDLLYDVEKELYDQKLSYRTAGRLPRTYTYTKGSRMVLKDMSYSFDGLELSWHFSFHPILNNYGRDTRYRYYVSNGLFDDPVNLSYECSRNRYNQGCGQSSHGYRLSNPSITVMQNRHKDRAYNQFIQIYYEPTQEILDKWYELYRPEEVRPQNELDLLVDSMN